MVGKIYGTGSCVPSRVMDNNDMAKIVETSDEWIRERTGIERRHIIDFLYGRPGSPQSCGAEWD